MNNNIRLYLNGMLVDLEPKTKVAVTRQINSFFELKDRQTSYTKRFKILLTKRSLKAVYNLGKPYNVSEIPYQPIRATIYDGPVCIIDNGVFRATEINSGYGKESVILKGSIQYGNLQLFKRMKQMRLNYLVSLDELNHNIYTYNPDENEEAQDIVQTRNNTWQNGYIYLKGNYGDDADSLFNNTSGDYHHIYNHITWNCPPSLFLKWLWNKIFEENGFTYSYVGGDNFFESADFENTVITIEKPFVYSLVQSVEFRQYFDTTTEYDVIKLACDMFGLVFQKDTNNNHYYFTSLNDLLNKKCGTQNLSKKLQKTKTIKYKFGSYGSYNKFKYKDNAWGYDFRINNSWLKGIKTLIESPFKGLPYIFHAEEKVSGIEEPKIRISEGCRVIYNDNGQVNTSVLDWYFLFRKYYKSFKEKALDKQEIMEVEMILSSQEVRNFDFFKLIYLEQYASYYYCNKIKNFVSGKPAKMELIKIR